MAHGRRPRRPRQCRPPPRCCSTSGKIDPTLVAANEIMVGDEGPAVSPHSENPAVREVFLDTHRGLRLRPDRRGDGGRRDHLRHRRRHCRPLSPNRRRAPVRRLPHSEHRHACRLRDRPLGPDAPPCHPADRRARRPVLPARAARVDAAEQAAAPSAAAWPSARCSHSTTSCRTPNTRSHVDGAAPCSFRTAPCAGLVDIASFGAREDADDNGPAIAAAIAATPPGGTLFVPPGRWLTAPLFLRSHLTAASRRGRRAGGRRRPRPLRDPAGAPRRTAACSEAGKGCRPLPTPPSSPPSTAGASPLPGSGDARRRRRPRRLVVLAEGDPRRRPPRADRSTSTAART